jgi:hypothetical protein
MVIGGGEVGPAAEYPDFMQMAPEEPRWVGL